MVEQCRDIRDMLNVFLLVQYSFPFVSSVVPTFSFERWANLLGGS
jgi:hypothetical protein